MRGLLTVFNKELADYFISWRGIILFGVVLLTAKGDPPQLAGIITERDLLLRVVGEKGILDRPAKELMTPDPQAEHFCVSYLIRCTILAITNIQ